MPSPKLPKTKAELETLLTQLDDQIDKFAAHLQSVDTARKQVRTAIQDLKTDGRRLERDREVTRKEIDNAKAFRKQIKSALKKAPEAAPPAASEHSSSNDSKKKRTGGSKKRGRSKKPSSTFDVESSSDDDDSASRKKPRKSYDNNNSSSSESGSSSDSE